MSKDLAGFALAVILVVLATLAIAYAVISARAGM